MEPGSNVPDHFFLRAGVHLAFAHLAGTPVNNLIPLLLGVCVHGVIEAGNELAGQIRPVLFRQGHHFGHFFGGNAHAAKISARRLVLASAMIFHKLVVSRKEKVESAFAKLRCGRRRDG
jgi:hypothetical protein